MYDQSYLNFQIFKEYSELLCAFSTRKGGFSSGNFSSLNLGINTGDSPGLVHKNRKLFYKKLNISEVNIAYPSQTHSSNAKIVEKPGIYADTDGLICMKRNIFLTIQTADCFPVFLYAWRERLVALIHVGWRGALHGILDVTLSSIEEDINVNLSFVKIAIGPGLGPECFEVQEDVYSQFPEKYLLKHKNNLKRYLDLKRFIYEKLLQRNVSAKKIYVDKACTKCNKDFFYSYRRDGHHSGRMMGIIGLK
ncbi:hypothetical protein AC481_01650 [miscellaneous Crenarchaeota group archaeon SMTZ-80]|nr:MAG: hypothetical protein AC481_01650 [miscellaneous Crenarchaeota group archaeon SMTZ-80]